MEKHKICSFFGHRKIQITKELQEVLFKLLKDLIVNHNVQTFLFGSRSQFDYLCHAAVTNLKQEFPYIQRVNYTCKSEFCVLEVERQKLEQVYSNFYKEKVHLLGFEKEIEHPKKYTAGFAGYVERNQAMINDSDFCVFYYDNAYKPDLRKTSKKSLSCYQPKSGTALAYLYAKKKRKAIINVFVGLD